ncbi:adenine phosphoribosyltransferase [Orussus abietinus]|uniref:adenine phosphoribosyltransferase n=1 Tax=Orussus abietinus TaxID=222816 RepID=UPI00062675E6|nr:adenine phosphoribosyltransferase [Orussus abietinus]
MDKNEKLKIVKDAIKSYPNFPKDGVLFRDIFSVFQDVEATRAMKDLLIEHVASLNIDFVVGLDSRGFLIGPLICLEIGKPFIPIRKKGKLPGNVYQQSFMSEYGEGVLEIQKEPKLKGKRVLLVDDLLATGGTLATAVKLVKSLEADIVECFVLIELLSLNGRSRFNAPVHALIQYD